MDAAELRVSLLKKIQNADLGQLEELNMLVTGFFNKNKDRLEDELTDLCRDKIDIGLKQANAGLGVSALGASQKLRMKYNENA